MPTIQLEYGWKRSTICAQAAYCLHSTKPSITWLNTLCSLAACDWAMSALSAVLSTRIGRRRKFGEVSCTVCTFQGNEFELIPTVEMETRNPVDGHYGSEFSAICYHFAELWRPKVARPQKFEKYLSFLEKRPLTVKLSKFSSEIFHRDTNRRVVCKFRKIWPTENRRNRALLIWQKNKISPGSPAVATARIAPEICQG